MRPALMLSFALALTVCMSAGADALAQDAPAAATDMEEVHDATSTVALSLPKGWTAYAHASGILGIWKGELGTPEVPCPGSVDVFVSRESSRPIQVLTRLTERLEPISPVSSGDGWVARTCTYRKGWTFWIRCIERAGFVVALRVSAKDRRAEDGADAVASRVLDSFRVTADPSAPPPPKGTTLHMVDGVEIWAADEPEQVLHEIAADVLKARTGVLKELKDKPVDTSAPAVWVFDTGTEFDQNFAIGTSNGGSPRGIGFLPHAGAIGFTHGSAVSGSAETDSVYWHAVEQTLSQWFGGLAPPWIEVGLSEWLNYHILSDGDPHKPSKRWMALTARMVQSENSRLDRQMMLDADAVRNPAGVCVSGVYHEFLRTAKESKKWRKTYEASLDAVRDTGDPEAAREAWNGTDFAALEKAVLKWTASRK